MALSLSEFADKMEEIMPVIMRASLKRQKSGFYKIKMTMPQFAVMSFLAGHGDTTMTHMARHMSVTTAAVTGIVDRLVRDGYVLRKSDPKDRRVVMVGLTSKGASLVERLKGERKRAVMSMFANISQRDREEYLRILTHLRDRLK